MNSAGFFSRVHLAGKVEFGGQLGFVESASGVKAFGVRNSKPDEMQAISAHALWFTVGCRKFQAYLDPKSM